MDGLGVWLPRSEDIGMWSDNTKVVLMPGRAKQRLHIWVVEAKGFNYAHYSTNPNDPHKGGFGPWCATAFYQRRSSARGLAATMRKIGPEGKVWRVVKYTKTPNVEVSSGVTNPEKSA